MTEETKTPFECVVSADLFRRAYAAVSKEETRYYLNGVSVEASPNGGALLVATDGRRLLAIRDPEGIVRGTGIVSLTKPMVAALGAKSFALPSWDGPLTGSGQVTRFLAVRNDKAAVIETRIPKDGAVDDEALLAMVDSPTPRVGAYQWARATIDGKFPDWRRALVGKPDFGAGVFGSYNAALLAPLAQALSGDKSPLIQMVPSEGADPMQAVYIFASDPRIDGFGLLMPTRTYRKDLALPPWFAPERSVAVAAE